MKLRQTGAFGLERIIVDEEYPVTYLEGASVDLLARFKASYRSHYVVTIECKRGYTARKKWIFFKDRDQGSKLIYEFRGQQEPDIYDALPLVADGVPVCIEGVEVDLLAAVSSLRLAAVSTGAPTVELVGRMSRP